MAVYFPGTANTGVAFDPTPGVPGPGIFNGRGEATFCCFWRPDNTGADSFRAIWGLQDANSSTQVWELLTTGATLHFRLSTNGGAFAVDSDAIVQGQWYFVAVTISDTKQAATLYWKALGAPACKSVQVTGVTQPNWSIANSDYLAIATSLSGGTGAKGSCRGFRIWARILRQDELELESRSFGAIARDPIGDWRLTTWGISTGTKGDLLDHGRFANHLVSLGSAGARAIGDPPISSTLWRAAYDFRRNPILVLPSTASYTSQTVTGTNVVPQFDDAKALLWEINENLKRIKMRLRSRL